MSVAPLVICRQCAKEYTTAKLSELTFGALFYLGIGIVLIGIALSVIGL